LVPLEVKNRMSMVGLAVWMLWHERKVRSTIEIFSDTYILHFYQPLGQTIEKKKLTTVVNMHVLGICTTVCSRLYTGLYKPSQLLS
jgi:hypothetical protein